MNAEEVADGIVRELFRLNAFGESANRLVQMEYVPMVGPRGRHFYQDDVRAIIVKHLSERTCEWAYSTSSDTWRGACGMVHQFYVDGYTPEQALKIDQFEYCPNCGGRIDARQEVQEQVG